MRDENVKFTRSADEASDIVMVREVSDNAPRTERCCECTQGFLSPAGDDQLGAACSARAGDCRSKAARGTGNKCPCASKVHRPPPSGARCDVGVDSRLGAPRVTRWQP